MRSHSLHFCSCRKDPTNVAEVVELVTKELSPNDDDDGLYIDIRRNFVLQDALRKGGKKKFSPRKHLKVWHELQHRCHTIVSSALIWVYNLAKNIKLMQL